ncbi:MAG: glycogen debranching enzyme N-terminal domain-containing protein [Kiritimatiellae bacterium]|nr:glycogen debranching enzyme N-terminal domain-containing protein [Kiritimatiellia bacterium]
MRIQEQTPNPGTHRVMHRGDTLTVSLTLAEPAPGRAFLRANLGRAAVRRAEIIRHIEGNRPILASDWHDIPMRRAGRQSHEITVPLLEVGRFEAKAFFLPADSDVPVWPAGDNVVVKVEPAHAVCANTVYTAFVRQFGPNGQAGRAVEGLADAVAGLDAAGYTVIPRSGTFRDLVRELDFITGTLRFRIVQLLPIHPLPTTYARMGRFGSPFAALDFLNVDPALAEFDRRTTPMEQFVELVDAAHSRRARLFLDIPVNHTGWASRLQLEHPEWFARTPDRQFESPGAWGVVWEDLSRLDYAHKGLWQYMAEVFLFWCGKGVDGFRCDAGYMVPVPVWEYIVAKVREQYPDTVFLLEGLGGKLEVVERLLSEANLDWAYSELFQNYDRQQISAYLPGCIRTSIDKGTLLHFAETHDNNRLAARSPAYARMRTALAALCSDCGAFGITNGVEWFAAEKLDVHGASPLNWGSAENQVEWIARLNAVLDLHPAFHAGSRARLVQRGDGNTMALLRMPAGVEAPVLVLVNLDDERPGPVAWPRDDFDATAPGTADLLGGGPPAVEHRDGQCRCWLEPGQVLCLHGDPSYARAIEAALAQDGRQVTAGLRQTLHAKVLELHHFYRGIWDVAGLDLDAEADLLRRDPRAYGEQTARGGQDMPGPARSIQWEWPQDTRRTVLLPAHHALCVSAPHPFLAELRREGKVLRREAGIAAGTGGHVALLLPEPAAATSMLTLHLTVYAPDQARHGSGPLLALGTHPSLRVLRSVRQDGLGGRQPYAVCTNGRGAMAQVRGNWAEIRSQYDCLLGANLDPDYPVDRHIMLTRCRAWLVRQGYAHAVNLECLDAFGVDEDRAVHWEFALPAGQGEKAPLRIRLKMHEGRNAIELAFHRPHRKRRTGRWVADSTPIQLIIRPDIEDRNGHGKTKAYTGPESAWPGAVTVEEKGFVFAPAAERRLRLETPAGTFTPEPEWQYMVGHPEEAERGLDGSSDLFSPGYFTLVLRGGGRAVLHAAVLAGADSGQNAPAGEARKAGTGRRARRHLALADALRLAMRDYLVARGEGRTVIAGYPWFLDWGRDTLIALRGLIAAGFTAEAREILTAFAGLERNGSLPNMLRGRDDSNRDTSDAPLWFLVACADLLRADGTDAFLAQPCGTRTLREVSLSIGRAYAGGTGHGVRMDADSGLIFSPSHFTWMDTNHPAGTPREGYPVEIQALWHAGLRLLASVDPAGPWAELAGRVRASIRACFWREEDGYLADCLHAAPGVPAAQAAADDALRPNQLLAVTLGALSDAPDLAGPILRACERLLVPGAIRSLADRPVRHALPVSRHGRQLNDPHRPYWGRYEGDEDTRRKPAYHNGTAWTWPFPSYAEALFRTFGPCARDAALAILSSSTELIDRGCIGQVPEIVDGDAPHTLRGCGAQAWGVTELYRVLALLTEKA